MGTTTRRGVSNFADIKDIHFPQWHMKFPGCIYQLLGPNNIQKILPYVVKVPTKYHPWLWVIFSWWSPIEMSGMFYLSVTLRLIHPCRDSIWRSFYPLPILGTKIEFPIFFVPLWLRLRLLPVNWRSWFEVQWLVSSTNEAWLMVLLVGVVVLSDFFNSLSYIYLCTFMYRCQLHHVGLKIHYGPINSLSDGL